MSHLFPSIDELEPHAEMPDPLTMFRGPRIQTRDQWEKERKPELKQLFQHYMYGSCPLPAEVTARIEREDSRALGGKAVLREVTLHLSSAPNAIHLLVVLPVQRSTPAPAFLGIAFCGTQAVLEDPAIRMAEGWMYAGAGVEDHRATEASRGTAVSVWNVEQSIDRGYAVAVFYNGNVEPDVPENTEGIRAHFRSGNPPDPDEWGAIAAWAWGMQRALDYLVTVPEIDAGRIAVVGHSRNGKAAILAAAFDERIALAIPVQAGCGGTAPSRATTGESICQINTAFPHWFNRRFKEFNDRPERLPFDQSGLVALIAPSPVLFANAAEDTWANPEGQFQVLAAADPVYHFLGVEGLGSDRPPPLEQLLSSRLGYFIRPGRHSMTARDWQAFLEFADVHLKSRGASSEC